MSPGPKRKAFDEKVARIRAGPGTMMIHLALDSLPDWRAGADLQSFAYVHVAPDLAMMSRVFAGGRGGPSSGGAGVLVVGQPTAIDPTRAPPGSHVLWVQVRVLPATIAGDSLGQISATAWGRGPRSPMPRRVLDRLEIYAPGLRAKILGRSIWSPLDLERENPCLIGGDNLTGSHHLDQNFIFRPGRGVTRVTQRRFRGSISAAQGPGQAPGPAPRRATCWRKCWRAKRRDEDPMRIVCIGGGPAELYFGLLMKKLQPEHSVTVIERNKPYDCRRRARLRRRAPRAHRFDDLVLHQQARLPGQPEGRWLSLSPDDWPSFPRDDRDCGLRAHGGSRQGRDPGRRNRARSLVSEASE